MAYAGARQVVVLIMGSPEAEPRNFARRKVGAGSAMKPLFSFIATAAFCLPGLVGCRDENSLELFPIRGEVTYQGKPLPEGTVVYLPQDSPGARQATGAIQPDGSFALMTRDENDGAMRGSYQIAIYAYKPHPGEPATREEHEALAKKGGLKREYLIPEKFADPKTSGLTDVVNEEHSGFKKFELN
jgi:hypothetical protein